MERSLSEVIDIEMAPHRLSVEDTAAGPPVVDCSGKWEVVDENMLAVEKSSGELLACGLELMMMMKKVVEVGKKEGIR